MLTGLRLAAVSLLMTACGALAAPARPPAVETVAPAPAPAKKTKLRIVVSENGETVYLTGVIDQGSFLMFEAALRDAPGARRLVLASIGGLTVEGRLIAALVRKRQLDTHVEFYCASACTQVFVAGRNRVIGPNAKLGFHQAVVVDKDGQAKKVRRATERKLYPTLVYGINGNDTLRLAYERAGIDPAFIARVLETRHADMWHPGAKDLLAAHVITGQAQTSEAVLPGNGPSRDEVRAMLTGKALWRQAAVSAPGEYARIAEDVWLWTNSGVSLDSALAAARTDLVEALTPRLLRASDAQLGSLLTLKAQFARDQRELDYPECNTADLLETSPTAGKSSKPDSPEDRLIAEIIASPPAQSPPSADEAKEVFWKEVMPAFGKAYRRGDTESAKGLCRYSLRLIEAIGELPLDRRVKAYRAMLALPEWVKA